MPIYKQTKLNAHKRKEYLVYVQILKKKKMGVGQERECHPSLSSIVGVRTVDPKKNPRNYPKTVISKYSASSKTD